jgi:lipopolysaccharide/colanic/teichoic acid biosynthesis glycosyltransferase
MPSMGEDVNRFDTPLGETWRKGLTCVADIKIKSTHDIECKRYLDIQYLKKRAIPLDSTYKLHHSIRIARPNIQANLWVSLNRLERHLV